MFHRGTATRTGCGRETGSSTVAAAFGPATIQVVEQILDRHAIEAQGYPGLPEERVA